MKPNNNNKHYLEYFSKSKKMLKEDFAVILDNKAIKYNSHNNLIKIKTEDNNNIEINKDNINKNNLKKNSLKFNIENEEFKYYNILEDNIKSNLNAFLNANNLKDFFKLISTLNIYHNTYKENGKINFKFIDNIIFNKYIDMLCKLNNNNKYANKIINEIKFLFKELFRYPFFNIDKTKNSAAYKQSYFNSFNYLIGFIVIIQQKEFSFKNYLNLYEILNNNATIINNLKHVSLYNVYYYSLYMFSLSEDENIYIEYANIIFNLFDYNCDGYIELGSDNFNILLKNFVYNMLFLSDFLMNYFINYSYYIKTNNNNSKAINFKHIFKNIFNIFDYEDLIKEKEDVEYNFNCKSNIKITQKKSFNSRFRNYENLYKIYTKQIIDFKKILLFFTIPEYISQFINYVAHNFIFIEKKSNIRLNKDKFIDNLKINNFVIFKPKYFRNIVSNYLNNNLSKEFLLFSTEIPKVITYYIEYFKNNKELNNAINFNYNKINHKEINLLNMGDKFSKYTSLINNETHFNFLLQTDNLYVNEVPTRKRSNSVSNKKIDDNNNLCNDVVSKKLSLRTLSSSINKDYSSSNKCKSTSNKNVNRVKFKDCIIKYGGINKESIISNKSMANSFYSPLVNNSIIYNENQDLKSNIVKQKIFYNFNNIINSVSNKKLKSDTNISSINYDSEYKYNHNNLLSSNESKTRSSICNTSLKNITYDLLNSNNINNENDNNKFIQSKALLDRGLTLNNLNIINEEKMYQSLSKNSKKTCSIKFNIKINEDNTENKEINSKLLLSNKNQLTNGSKVTFDLKEKVDKNNNKIGRTCSLINTKNKHTSNLLFPNYNKVRKYRRVSHESFSTNSKILSNIKENEYNEGSQSICNSNFFIENNDKNDKESKSSKSIKNLQEDSCIYDIYNNITNNCNNYSTKYKKGKLKSKKLKKIIVEDEESKNQNYRKLHTSKSELLINSVNYSFCLLDELNVDINNHKKEDNNNNNNNLFKLESNDNENKKNLNYNFKLNGVDFNNENTEHININNVENSKELLTIIDNEINKNNDNNIISRIYNDRNSANLYKNNNNNNNNCFSSVFVDINFKHILENKITYVDYNSFNSINNSYTKDCNNICLTITDIVKLIFKNSQIDIVNYYKYVKTNLANIKQNNLKIMYFLFNKLKKKSLQTDINEMKYNYSYAIKLFKLIYKKKNNNTEKERKQSLLENKSTSKCITSKKLSLKDLNKFNNKPNKAFPTKDKFYSNKNLLTSKYKLDDNLTIEKNSKEIKDLIYFYNSSLKYFHQYEIEDFFNLKLNKKVIEYYLILITEYNCMCNKPPNILYLFTIDFFNNIETSNDLSKLLINNDIKNIIKENNILIIPVYYVNSKNGLCIFYYLRIVLSKKLVFIRDNSGLLSKYNKSKL